VKNQRGEGKVGRLTNRGGDPQDLKKKKASLSPHEDAQGCLVINGEGLRLKDKRIAAR